MIEVKTGVSPEAIRQSARHVLFVEGKDGDAIDPQALDTLFGGMIKIEPLGASYHIQSAAEALYKYHPNYYFLMDRDHHDDSFVEDCWKKFPDPDTDNLLVWRCREIENYFIIPEYLMKSRFLKKGMDVDKLKALSSIHVRRDCISILPTW